MGILLSFRNAVNAVSFPRSKCIAIYLSIGNKNQSRSESGFSFFIGFFSDLFTSYPLRFLPGRSSKRSGTMFFVVYNERVIGDDDLSEPNKR